MKRGDFVVFILDHKLMDGILIRQSTTEAFIRTKEKLYKVKKIQVATEDIGGKNARARFGVRNNNAGNSRCDGKENKRFRTITGREEQSTTFSERCWPV